MARQFHIAESLALTTVRIECLEADGEVSLGTALLFDFPRGQAHAPVLITNWHVVRSSIGLSMKLRSTPGSGDQAFDLGVAYCDWIRHPDPNIDLAALPIVAQLEDMIRQGRSPYYQAITRGELPTAEHQADFSAVEKVWMVGYPEGVWDSVNNLPIIRSGITATHPAVDYEARSEFLVDLAVFPGSSGSPIFLDVTVARVARIPKPGKVFQETPPLLLGIVQSAVAVSNDDQSPKIIEAPTSRTSKNGMRTLINLGTVVKSKAILAFDQLIPESATWVNGPCIP